MRFIHIIPFGLAFLLSACGNSEVDSNQTAKVDAAIAKACDHFRADGNVTDLFGMEKDFTLLAKTDISYLRLAELAADYIVDFGKAIDSSVGKPNYPEVPRLLKNFCASD
jgi:hypothetical protein